MAAVAVVKRQWHVIEIGVTTLTPCHESQTDYRSANCSNQRVVAHGSISTCVGRDTTNVWAVQCHLEQPKSGLSQCVDAFRSVVSCRAPTFPFGSIISLPYAVSQSGWLVGILCLLMMALFGYSTMNLMIHAVHLTRSRLRRRRKATERHDAMMVRRMQGGNMDVVNGTSVSIASAVPSGASSATIGQYGSLNDTTNGMDPSPSPNLNVPADEESGSVGMSPSSDSMDDFATDPIDDTKIVADPDCDILNYQQVSYVVAGEWGRVITDGTLIFTQLGSCAAFLVLIFSSMQACFASYHLHVSYELQALILFPIVAALCLPRSTTYLAPAAHFGNATLLVVVGTIFYFGLTQDLSKIGAAMHAPIHAHESWMTVVSRVMSEMSAFSGSMQGVFIFFGIAAFSFAAHCEIVAVEADAKSREVYQVILPASIGCITLIYIAVSIFSFACFGVDTQPNIMLNLGETMFVNLVRLALSLTLIINIAMAIFPANQTLDLVILGPAPASTDLPHQHEPGDSPRVDSSSQTPKARANGENSGVAAHAASSETAPLLQSGSTTSSQTDQQWPAPSFPTSSPLPSPPPSLQQQCYAAHAAYHRKGSILRVLSVASTFLFAIIVQNLGVLFSLVGSLIGGLLCFWMPPFFYWRLRIMEKQPLSNWERGLLLLQLIGGTALMAAGAAVCVMAAE